MNELKKIYWHEKQLLIAIPMLISYATTFELVESLTVLSKYTHAHIKLLEEQFPEIDRETLPE
jgi:ferritin-like metal-binding protein YciE